MKKSRKEKAEAGGKTPLEFLLGVMRDPKNDMARRIDAAKAAASYVGGESAVDFLKKTGR